MRLAELISKRKEELGASFKDLADAAEAAGYPLHRASLSALVRDDMTQWPHRDTLVALAIILDRPVSTVIDSAAESLGIAVDRPDTDTDSVRSWLALTGNRSQAEVEQLLTVARTVAAALDTQQGQEDR